MQVNVALRGGQTLGGQIPLCSTTTTEVRQVCREFGPYRYKTGRASECEELSNEGQLDLICNWNRNGSLLLLFEQEVVHVAFFTILRDKIAALPCPVSKCLGNPRLVDRKTIEALTN